MPEIPGAPQSKSISCFLAYVCGIRSTGHLDIRYVHTYLCDISASACVLYAQCDASGVESMRMHVAADTHAAAHSQAYLTPAHTGTCLGYLSSLGTLRCHMAFPLYLLRASHLAVRASIRHARTDTIALYFVHGACIEP